MTSTQFFKIDGGGGDQNFFGQQILLRRVDEGWFPKEIPGRGPALLLQVVGGKFANDFVGVTSRIVTPLEEQLHSGGASVVVHRMSNPGPSFDPNRDADAIGMSFIEVVSRD